MATGDPKWGAINRSNLELWAECIAGLKHRDHAKGGGERNFILADLYFFPDEPASKDAPSVGRYAL